LYFNVWKNITQHIQAHHKKWIFFNLYLKRAESDMQVFTNYIFTDLLNFDPNLNTKYLEQRKAET